MERQSRADIFGAVGSGKYDGYVMIAAFGIFRNLAVHPQRAPLLENHLDAAFKGSQDVRIESRLIPQIFGIIFFHLFLMREQDRYVFYLSDIDFLFEIPFYTHGSVRIAEGLCLRLVQIIIPMIAIGNLERYSLLPEACKLSDWPCIQHPAFGKDLFQGADNSYVIIHNLCSSC